MVAGRPGWLGGDLWRPISISISSTAAFTSAMRVSELAAAAGIEVRWMPFNLRAILIEQNNTAFLKNAAKMNYFWHDVERRAERHSIPFAGRAPYPVDPDLLALRVDVIASLENWCGDYSQTTFHEWFIGRRAPGVGGHVERVLDSLNKPSKSIIDRANSTEGGRLLEEITDRARRLGIFGAPTFAIGQEIFWGDDHLEEALNFASNMLTLSKRAPDRTAQGQSLHNLRHHP